MLEKNILCSTYRTDWSHGFDFNFLAHELVHAAQDEAIDLEDFQRRHYQTLDSLLAASALMEGQAQAFEVLRMFMSLDTDDARDDLKAILAEYDDIARDTGESPYAEVCGFPYNAGVVFALRRYLQDGVENFAAMYRQVPTSAEQILHHDKFLAAEAPRTTYLQNKLSDGQITDGSMRPLYQTVLGEYLTRQMLLNANVEKSIEAAAGWGGDYVVLLTDDSDNTLLLWDSFWDSPQDAEEFFRAIREYAANIGDGEKPGAAPPFDLAFPVSAPRIVATRRNDRVVVAMGQSLEAWKATRLAVWLDLY